VIVFDKYFISNLIIDQVLQVSLEKYLENTAELVAVGGR